jgi:hypothetical protein
LRLAPRTGAATRFGIWYAALIVLLTLPWVRLAVASPGGAGPGAQSSAIHLPAAWPVALLTAWAAIAAVLLGRLAWSYGYVRWLAYRSTPADYLGRNVRLSLEASVPMVIGLLRPAILVPRALLADFSAGELEQILLHERAHIRRGDHWTNYALELAQALFFFQPAVWWIGRELRLHREIACDDAVVHATGEPVPYAGCLAKLVELSACPPVSLSPGASGDGRDLFQRVERLLAWSGAAGFSARRFASASLLLMAAALGFQRMPALIDIPAPSLALAAPRPDIEASRQRLVTEERLQRADILMETAQRMIREADRQMRKAVRIAQGSVAAPWSPVACRQPAASPLPQLNKI